MADDKSILLHELKIHSWTLRSWRSLQFAIWCALGVQLAMIVLIPMREVLKLQDQTYMYVCASIAAFVIGGAFGLLMPLSHHLVATVLDAKSQLQERVQSALEFLQRDDLPLAKLLTKDAIQSLERSRSQKGTPGGGFPLEWRSLLAAALTAALLLAIPPIPAGPLSKRSMIETRRTPTVPVLGAEMTKSQAANDDKERVSSPASGQLLTTKVAFKDSAFASEPPDFVSFVKSGDDRLGLLEPDKNESATEPHPKPIRIAPQGQGQRGEAGFEAGNLSAEEATERMTEFEEVMKRSSTAAQERDEDQAQGQRLSAAGDPSSTPATSQAPDASDQAGKSSLQEEIGKSQKGPAKDSITPAKDSLGAPSGDQIETPGWSPVKQTYNQKMQTARFGGGQYPHNAPGAGFPEWMRGNEDPHFMDAGQGEGASTGKTSGQAGVGHALMNKGLESPTLKLPSIMNLYLPGQIQEGEQTSYETDMLGPGAGSSLNVPYTNVLIQYEFQAEEQMSRNQVPYAFRAHVKAYFSRIR